MTLLLVLAALPALVSGSQSDLLATAARYVLRYVPRGPGRHAVEVRLEKGKGEEWHLADLQREQLIANH